VSKEPKGAIVVRGWRAAGEQWVFRFSRGSNNDTSEDSGMDNHTDRH
jgi:hypothetical protein